MIGEPEGGILAALGLKAVNVIVGAISSFVALRFFNDLTLAQKWTTFFGGWAIASWGGEPLLNAFGLNPKVEIGLVLLLGLLGMAIAAEMIKLVQAISWDVIRGFVVRK